MRSENRTILLTLGAVLAAVAFHDVSRRYDGFRLWEGPPAGYEPHPVELGFLLWYLVLGGIAAGCLALALASHGDAVPQLEARLRRAAASGWFLPVAALAVLTAALAVKDLVLAGAPLSDDESVYAFIAKTLARGRLTNPPPAVPPSELGYFDTNFVVLTGESWFGKYPIGHPLLLAAGEVLGARAVVGPLLAVGTLLATAAVARRLLGPVGAAVAAILVALSPQIVLTAATDASQNTSQLAAVLGLWFLLRAGDAEGAARTRELAAAGAALGFGVLARPMPGVLFVAAAACWVLVGWGGVPLAARARALVAPALVVASFLGVIAAVNWQQTGHPFVSGYQVTHGGLPGVDAGREGIFSASLGAALLRQWFWAFGWPVSYLFLPLAVAWRGGAPRLAPVWLFVLAGYAYRLTTPKVFVGTTGPIYVAEVVPLLAVLTAAGMLHARARLEALRAGAGRAVAAAAVGSAVAAAVLFLPFQIRWLGRVAEPQRFTPDTLARAGVTRAIVFSTNVADAGESWALWPPPPAPGLDEPLLYVRRKKLPEANVAFWKQYFPDRAAFVLEIGGGARRLRPLAPGSERPLTDRAPAILEPGRR